jgi:hypothetical protein
MELHTEKVNLYTVCNLCDAKIEVGENVYACRICYVYMCMKCFCRTDGGKVVIVFGNSKHKDGACEIVNKVAPPFKMMCENAIFDANA